MIFEFGQYIIDIDTEKTKLFYNTYRNITEGCSCPGCRNYVAAVATLPPEVVGVFTNLGVDMKKVCEVYVCCTSIDKTLLYGGFYHICGNMLSGKSVWVSTAPSMSHQEESRVFRITNDFCISFQNECHCLESNFPQPVLQMEISANIPWVLVEENTYL